MKGKRKAIVCIAIIIGTIVPGIMLSNAQTEPVITLYAQNGDSPVAYTVTDTVFLSEDSLLLLQRKKGSDTIPGLAKVSYAPTAARDSNVLSMDTLTHVRPQKK